MHKKEEKTTNKKTNTATKLLLYELVLSEKVRKISVRLNA
jgi:hypothetical protein